MFELAKDDEDPYHPYGKEVGVIRELLLDFYHLSKQTKPAQIVVFRDGVSESQFSQVLDNELKQMIEAYKVLNNRDNVPKFTVIVVQKVTTPITRRTIGDGQIFCS